MSREIFVTENDLTRLLRVVNETGDLRSRSDLAALLGELARATLVPSEDVPPNVVTMNSRVILRDMDSGELLTLTLVFPERADAVFGRVSVLAPVGTAILGYAQGSVVEWPVPSGTRRLRIEDVLYQPEAAGDFHL